MVRGEWSDFQSKLMKQTQQDVNFLTLAEAAARLRISNHTVYKMCRNGEIPARRVGRQWRIRVSDLDDWLARQTPELSARPGGSVDPLESLG